MKPAPDPRNRLIAQIHVAKKQLGLTEAEYRGLLASAAGKESSAAMNAAELGRVIEALVKAGFRPAGKGAQWFRKSPHPQVRLIFGLWTELGRIGAVGNASRPALFAFVKRMSGVDHPDWLDKAQISKIVEALKAMRDRAKEEA